MNTPPDAPLTFLADATYYPLLWILGDDGSIELQPAGEHVQIRVENQSALHVDTIDRDGAIVDHAPDMATGAHVARFVVDAIRPHASHEHVEIDDLTDDEFDRIGDIHGPLFNLIQSLVRGAYHVTWSILDRRTGKTKVEASRDAVIWAEAVWHAAGQKGTWEFDAALTGILSDGLQPQTADAIALEAEIAAPQWAVADNLDGNPEWHGSYGATLPVSALPPLTPTHSPTDSEIDMRFKQVADWATENGFRKRLARPTIDDVDRHISTGRGSAGVYLLEFADGSCYVGQSAVLHRRFRAHMRTYSDIVAASFIIDDEASASKKPKKRLDDLELPLIHGVQRVGLIARNKAEMTIVTHGERSLDREISAEQQSAWRTDRIATNGADLRGRRRSDVLALATAGAQGYERMYSTSATDDAVAVEDAVADYVARCLPFPVSTELGFWTTSCMPSSKRGPKGDRSDVIACLSIGMTEVLTIGRTVTEREYWSLLQVRRSALFPADDPHGAVRFFRRHPGIIDGVADYRDSGPGSLLLHSGSIEDLRRLLDDVDVTRAAAVAAIDLMRKRAAPNSRKLSHNPTFAAAVLSRARRR